MAQSKLSLLEAAATSATAAAPSPTATELFVCKDLKNWFFDEENRLLTYKSPWLSYLKFPYTIGISVYTMAAHGFYYVGREDRIQCAFCGVELYNFSPFDDIASLHIQRSPACPLITSPFDCGNVVGFSRDSLVGELKRAQCMEYHLARERKAKDSFALIEQRKVHFASSYEKTADSYRREYVMRRRNEAYNEMKRAEKDILKNDRMRDNLLSFVPPNEAVLRYRSNSTYNSDEVVKNAKKALQYTRSASLPAISPPSLQPLYDEPYDFKKKRSEIDFKSPLRTKNYRQREQKKFKRKLSLTCIQPLEMLSLSTVSEEEK
jgi:hypothetical protein